MDMRVWRRWALLLPILIRSLAAESGQAQEPFFSKHGMGIAHPLQETRRSHLDTDAAGNGGISLNHAELLHVFCINGGDPLCVGNLNGLAQFIKSQGFPHTYFGQLWHANRFHNQIKEIHASDPQAQIVLVGYSAGANRVRSLANELDAEGIAVALVAYLAGDSIGNNDYSRPKNVARIVNIRTRGLILYGGNLIFKGEEINGARNVFVEARHMLLPSRSATIECLVQELVDTANRSGSKHPPVPDDEERTPSVLN